MGLERHSHSPSLEELAHISEVGEGGGDRVVSLHILGDELVADGVLLMHQEDGAEEPAVAHLGERLHRRHGREGLEPVFAGKPGKLLGKDAEGLPAVPNSPVVTIAPIEALGVPPPEAG